MHKVDKHHLPIESIPLELAGRSSIFTVCFCFLFSIAAHFTHLPLWVSACVVFALIWRCLQNLGRVKAVHKWLLVPMVLIGGISVFAEYWTIVGRDAGLALLTVMASFKLLESRNHRDLLILIFLCYFLIATHFLFSQSILTATLMFATLIIITTTLVTINQRDDSITLVTRLKVSMRLIGMAIPLMLILFILVPRIPGPLWGLTDEQRGGITGLSDTMSPGKISDLIRSNEVAFRVDFKTDVPAQQNLYWRGPVMAMFNGRSWYQSRRKAINRFDLTVFEAATEYTITLEPNGERWLLALDIPMQLVNDSFMTADFQLTSNKPINDLRRYSLESRLKYQVGRDELSDYLDLTRDYPADKNPRTIALGQELARQYGNPEDIIRHVLTMFREQEYIYTLKPPILRDHVVDQFLFESRSGFCEHYAGSFALLMRAAGIPSRIVAGYQGGEFNEVGNYLIVRQSDAHAWTEVWLEDKGWVRIDPTAAVSPSRIEQGIDNALPDEVASFRIQNRNPLFSTLLFGWDNLQHGWNDWVLNYDQRKQSTFLSNLDIGIENWSDMVFALIFLLLSVIGSYWAVDWYRTRPAKPADYEQQFNRLLKRLARHGLEKRASEDSRAFLQRIAERCPGQQAEIAQIIHLYNAIKYGYARENSASRAELKAIVSSIKI